MRTLSHRTRLITGWQVLGKLQSITDEEFAEISLEAAEDM